MKKAIYIGFDPREAAAYAVARHSLLRHLTDENVTVDGLILSDLQGKGLYRRPTWYRHIDGSPVMWDVISEAPMSTEHANARFLIREVAGPGPGWAVFMDGDILVRGDMSALFDMLNPEKALYCVRHDYEVTEGEKKMDGQIQTVYARKNWSSVFALNLDHPANQELTVDLVNRVPGRDLHRFCWLRDEDIGGLPLEWNYLVNQSPEILSPVICHFTLGTPDMLGYGSVEYSEEWRRELYQWAS